jgi:hypothetical protein
MKEIPNPRRITVTSSLNEYQLTSWEKGWGWARPNPFLLQASVATFIVPDGASNDTRLLARCHFQGPKKSRFSGPNPLPLALVMDLNHRCINS